MKTLDWKRAAVATIALTTILGIKSIRADEPVTIYLMNEADFAEINADNPSDDQDIPIPPLPTVVPSTPKIEAPKKAKSLDDVLKETKATPLTERQKRVVSMIERDQKDFILSLDAFVKSPFNPDDDKAVPEFNKIRDKVVELVMKASTERSYYERLYLINSIWLSHQEEALRFSSLDRHLRDQWQAQDEKRRHIQSMVVAGASIIGAGVGGFVTFKMTANTFAVKATDGVLSKFAKWGGRASFTIAGAYVGSLLGRYVGFLGSDYVFGHMRDYLDPVDGTEDLKDLLDEIDPTP